MKGVGPSRAWHRAAVAYWWAMLALSVIVSAYGNVRHAEAVAPVEHLAVARWIAGALPVTLLLMVEGIAIGVRAGVAGWQRWMSTAFVAALAAVVLASSYVGLLSLVEATGLFGAPALNFGLAAVPDLLMIAATVYVMSLREPAEAAAPETRRPGAWSRIGGNLVARVEMATAPKTETVESAVDAPVELTDELVASSVDGLVELPSSSGVELPDGSAVSAVELELSIGELSSTTTRHPAELGRQVVEQVPTSSSSSGGAPVELPDDTRDELTDELTHEPVTSSVDDPPARPVELVPSSSPDEVDDPPTTTDYEGWRRVADEVVATSKISAGPDDLARVLALDAGGVSKQRIADEVGRSRSTITGWLKTVEEMEIDRPQLAAVR